MKTPENPSQSRLVLEAELKKDRIQDPHIAYMQTVANIFNKFPTIGLSVRNLKGLVERVFTSGELFDPEHTEPRLDFQPVMIALSDTFHQVAGIDVVMLNERLYSVQAIAQTLSLSPADLQEKVRGKTLQELDPAVRTFLRFAEDPMYKEFIDMAINSQIAEIAKKIAQPESQDAIAAIDITSTPKRYPDRALTDVESLYLTTLASVAKTTQHDADGTSYPLGLSETYLYDLWNGITALHGEYVPRVDFDPVAAALSPLLQEKTGVSLQPILQLYDSEVVSLLMPIELSQTATLSSSPEQVRELLEHYDNIQTETVIAQHLAKLQPHVS